MENSESLLADCIQDEIIEALLRSRSPSESNDTSVKTIGFARTGGGMYGQRNHDFLRPIVTLKAQVRHVHIVSAGTPVGYDRSWTAKQDTIIATLAIGFADGYSRYNSNRSEVGIRGHRFSIAGKVCMDMMMVDCGPPEGCGSEVQPGDYAVLYS